MHPLVAHLVKIIAYGTGAIAGIGVLFAAVLWIVLSGFDPCGNRVLAEHVSPSGRHRAIVFIRDCGATTGFATHVSVIDATGSPPEEGGNIFTIDQGLSVADAEQKLGPQIAVHWIDNTRLAVAHNGTGRVIRSLRAMGHVTIDYESIQ